MLSVLQNRVSYVLYPPDICWIKINQFTSWEFVAKDLVSTQLQFYIVNI